MTSKLLSKPYCKWYRKGRTVEETQGYLYNQTRDWYRRPTSSTVFLVARDFYHKHITRAIENDFGFTTNGYIDRRSWDARGIQFVSTAKRNLPDFYRNLSKNRLGYVFIVCSPRSHRASIVIDRNRHLVLLAPYIHHNTWPNLSVFKLAAEYLNIDPNYFRPD